MASGNLSRCLSDPEVVLELANFFSDSGNKVKKLLSQVILDGNFVHALRETQ